MQRVSQVRPEVEPAKVSTEDAVMWMTHAREVGELALSIPQGSLSTTVAAVAPPGGPGSPVGDELFRRCPVCQSTEVRRSSFHGNGGSCLGLYSPYRCRNCDAHFRVVSEKFKGFAVTVGGVAAAAAIVMVLAFLTLHVG